jgi:hypothetical protein
MAADGEPAVVPCAGGQGSDVQAGERRRDQVKPVVEKGSPIAGGWGAASQSMHGVFHFNEAMPRGDMADSASHMGGAAHAGRHGNQGRSKIDSAAVNRGGSYPSSTRWDGSGTV